MDLLDYYHIPVEGKDVTIIGRSNIVGKPLADLMMAAGATVTQCHSKTSVQQLGYCVSAADIVVSAVGKPHFITSKWLMPGQTIIDVGINRDENGKLCGDVDYIPEIVGECAITPVPGGVGPMTVIELMKNTVECWRKNI
jgi:methylenetetrahydrofolate dehydrogenase (NADP+)/methenyltetrahydrofolate cyclohydrolase